MSIRMPPGGALRVEVLGQYDPPRPSADPALIDLVRLTARICNCPVAAVMLLDGERRTYSAVFGATLVEQDDAKTPCDRTVLLAGAAEADQIYEVPDAYLDDLYAETGLAIGGHVYRFYAGTPLVNI